jgi:hypothetical protein
MIGKLIVLVRQKSESVLRALGTVCTMVRTNTDEAHQPPLPNGDQINWRAMSPPGPKQTSR